MDTEIMWQVSENLEGLLEAISTIKRELTKHCFAKFGSAKILEFKVSAPGKVCELLTLSVEQHTFIKCKEFDSYCHKAVAVFDNFHLFKTKLYGDSTVRVEARFDIGEGVGKYWYGNITLT
jgi:hypothetical protein